MRPLALVAAALLTLAALPLHAQVNGGAAWERSVVNLQVTQKRYDLIQPWERSTRDVSKAGVVIGDNLVLTPANNLNDHILIRLQKGGRGRWWNGRLVWIDYHANLALIAADDNAFFDGLEPVEMAGKDFNGENLKVARWSGGRLEVRKAEFDEWNDTLAEISFIAYLQLRVTTDANGIGAGEPVFDGAKLVGLTTAKGGDTANLIPSVFIKPILAAREKGTYKGLGYFDFTWQPTRNPDILKYLGLKGEPRGVVVIKNPDGKKDPAVKVRDLILEVDGQSIDNEGEYFDPEFGNLTLENLSTRNGRWAGDTVKIKVLREGKEMVVDYTIPAADYGVDLVPDYSFDQEPEFVMFGGLVFQPLTEDFLRRWGNGWERRAPFQLTKYRDQSATKERPGVVVLTVVIPDPINLGYMDCRYQVVEKINGKDVHLLTDIPKALKASKNAYHVIEFARGGSQQRLVLDKADLENSTKRVMARYGIPMDSFFNSPLTGGE